MINDRLDEEEEIMSPEEAIGCINRLGLEPYWSNYPCCWLRIFLSKVQKKYNNILKQKR